MFRLNLESKVALKLYGHHRNFDAEQERQDGMEKYIIHPMSDFRLVEHKLTFKETDVPIMALWRDCSLLHHRLFLTAKCFIFFQDGSVEPPYFPTRTNTA